MRFVSFVSGMLLFTAAVSWAQHPDWEGGYADGCTTITVGKAATADGSVITSHTDDSHRTRSWMNVSPAKKHPMGATTPMYKRGGL